ncbi:hypothetical protein C0585_01915 [Candidatus Woesearchaeota archaeon]|nr:MAG: hypothetical protein C0585_01915 [Candidatus Woesearchaeota archaeon]
MSDENNKSIQRELDFSLISKITERCNLSCSYCYLKDKKDLEMSINTAENLIREFLAFNKSFAHFTWVGGEPLLMPDSFFEEIKNFEEKYNINNLNVSHSIQTNGLKLTPNRFDNLKRMGFKIGISYDGTPDLQSERMNNNQIDISLDNIYYAKGKAGLLAVLSKKTIGKEEEIYDFFRRNTTFAKLNFFSPTGHGAEKKE